MIKEVQESQTDLSTSMQKGSMIKYSAYQHTG